MSIPTDPLHGWRQLNLPVATFISAGLWISSLVSYKGSLTPKASEAPPVFKHARDQEPSRSEASRLMVAARCSATSARTLGPVNSSTTA